MFDMLLKVFLPEIPSIVLRIIFPVSTLQSVNVNHLQNICGTKQYDEKIKVRVYKSQKKVRNLLMFFT
jgi:hypothetical protein